MTFQVQEQPSKGPRSSSSIRIVELAFRHSLSEMDEGPLVVHFAFARGLMTSAKWMPCSRSSGQLLKALMICYPENLGWYSHDEFRSMTRLAHLCYGDAGDGQYLAGEEEAQAVVLPETSSEKPLL
jgi:hypothetical protein